MFYYWRIEMIVGDLGYYVTGARAMPIQSAAHRHKKTARRNLSLAQFASEIGSSQAPAFQTSSRTYFIMSSTELTTCQSSLLSISAALTDCQKVPVEASPA
jgi:hypothetical protein